MIPFIYILSFMNSLIFMQMNHPLTMGLILLIQTILISLITGMITKSFWFSYILFLIFVGGMLVLFIYVTSLASNEMFSFSIKLLMNSLMFMTISYLLIYMFMDQSMFNSNIINNEMYNLNNELSYFMENSLSLNKLYNFPTNFITILLMNYLLITLIAIVKITKLFYGPLRMMN